MKSYKIGSEQEYKLNRKRELWHKLNDERYINKQLLKEIKKIEHMTIAFPVSILLGAVIATIATLIRAWIIK